MHLAYVREHAGHALIGARQWIPREQIEDPVRSLVMGLPLDLGFRTKGQLAIDIATEAFADGVRFDFFCGDEVYGNCTELRAFFEERGQGYVLRVPSNFRLTLAWRDEINLRGGGQPAAGWQAPPGGPLRREGLQGSPLVRAGRGWAPPVPAHCLLVRRHLKTGELAFHYCFVPAGQPLTMTRLIRAAGLRWPVEEDFEFGKDCFGLDQSQVRLYTAIARHTVLVMAALAICAITAALLKDRTDTQAPPPARPDQPPPADPGMIPLTVPETGRLLAALLHRPSPPGHTAHWSGWRRRHQARSRWYHQRTRLATEAR